MVRSIADGAMPLVCGQLLILFPLVKFTLRNVTHLEEQTASGGGLSNVDVSLVDEGQVLLLGDSRRAIRGRQFGFNLSVELVGDQGDTHSSFERFAAVVVLSIGIVCSGTSLILLRNQLNHANILSHYRSS